MRELIPGVKFPFGGGRVYVIPPLSLGALQRLQGDLAALNDGTALEPAAVATVLQAAHSALKRNYPDITVEEVAELVDVGNMHEVIACVLDVTGVKRKATEEIEAAKNLTARPVEAQTPTPTGLP